MLAEEALYLGEPCAHAVAFYDVQRWARITAKLSQLADRRRAPRPPIASPLHLV